MSASPLPSRGDAISLLAEVSVLLRHRRLLIGLPLVLAVAAVSLTLALGRTYVAESRFTPQSAEGGLARVAGLAAQFGISLGAGPNPSESVDFYSELLRSRELLAAAVQTEYRIAKRPGSTDSLIGTLVDIYQVKRPTRDATLLAAIDRLRNSVAVSTGLRRAGIVTVRTKARWPELAVGINRRLLELLGEFNLRQRQSQAAAERRFVEGRLSEVRKELGSAESELAGFLEKNRQFESSPRLRFEAERLRRRVDVIQQVYSTLAMAYEQSRIEEVRNTPVITIVDSPEGSSRRGESLRFNALAGLLLGGLLAAGLAFLIEHIARERVANPDAYREFQAIAHNLSPGRLLRRRAG